MCDKRVKSKFTKEEDEMLKVLVNHFGNSSWKEVSHSMIRRTARQCRERWKLYLSPDIKNGPWSREEDSQLTNLVSSEGRLWA